jgi:hypothetical protein
MKLLLILAITASILLASASEANLYYFRLTWIDQQYQEALIDGEYRKVGINR